MEWTHPVKEISSNLLGWKRSLRSLSTTLTQHCPQVGSQLFNPSNSGDSPLPWEAMSNILWTVQGEGGGNGLQDAAGEVLSQNAEAEGEEQQDEILKAREAEDVLS